MRERYTRLRTGKCPKLRLVTIVGRSGRGKLAVTVTRRPAPSPLGTQLELVQLQSWVALFNGLQGTREPVYPAVAREVVPDERQCEDTSQKDNCVVHVPKCGCRLRWEEEDDAHEKHERDRYDSAGTALISFQE